jgi:hypothetical protein
VNVGTELMKDNHRKEILSSVYAWMDGQIDIGTSIQTDGRTDILKYICMCA